MLILKVNSVYTILLISNYNISFLNLITNYLMFISSYSFSKFSNCMHIIPNENMFVFTISIVVNYYVLVIIYVNSGDI